MEERKKIQRKYTKWGRKGIAKDLGRDGIVKFKGKYRPRWGGRGYRGNDEEIQKVSKGTQEKVSGWIEKRKET